MAEYRIIERGGMFIVQKHNQLFGWGNPAYGGGPFFDLKEAVNSKKLLEAGDESRPYTVVVGQPD